MSEPVSLQVKLSLGRLTAITESGAEIELLEGAPGYFQLVRMLQARHDPTYSKPGISIVAISDMVRVCHCGKTVESSMERCNGCPGHSGAGKVVKYAADGRKVFELEDFV